MEPDSALSEVTWVRVCEEGSRLREWPGGLAVQSDVLAETRWHLAARARSTQRRDLRPAVTQVGGGGASRTAQSGESLEPYVRATRCGRWGLGAVAAVRPRLASPRAVLKGLGSFRHILCRRELRRPRQSHGGRPGTPESGQW